MKKIFIAISFLILSFSGDLNAFSLRSLTPGWWQYRKEACGSSLTRTVFALVKGPLYEGCLEAAWEALNRENSRLSKHFQRTYDLKQRRYDPGYDPETKLILIRAIEERLGKPRYQTGFFEVQRPVTQESHDAFQRHLRDFCGSTGALAPVTDVETVLGKINPYRLFRGFRETLAFAKALGDEQPRDLRELKKLRMRFVRILNQVVVLKKALVGEKFRGEGYENDYVATIMRQMVVGNGRWVGAYKRVKERTITLGVCNTQEGRTLYRVAFKEMDNLVRLIKSLSDLSTQCRPF